MQHRVAGTVGRATAALHRGARTEVLHVAAERALVHGTVGIAVERHAVMLELVPPLGRHAAQELDRVLVAR
jgi:hypothetical protein